MTDYYNFSDGYKQFDLLQLSASTKIKSEHPIAQAIVRKATEKNSYIKDLRLILLLASAITSYFEKITFVGNHRKINNQMIGPQNLSGRITDLGSEGKNVIAAFMEDKLVGLLAVSDTLRENAKQLLRSDTT